MTITSKFNGKCVVCGGDYKAGEMIEWESRGRARHVACQPKPKIMLRDALLTSFESMRGAASIDEAIDRATKTLDMIFSNAEVS